MAFVSSVAAAAAILRPPPLRHSHRRTRRCVPASPAAAAAAAAPTLRHCAWTPTFAGAPPPPAGTAGGAGTRGGRGRSATAPSPAPPTAAYDTGLPADTPYAGSLAAVVLTAFAVGKGVRLPLPLLAPVLAPLALSSVTPALGGKFVSDFADLSSRPGSNSDLVAPPGVAEGVSPPKRRSTKVFAGVSVAEVRDAFFRVARTKGRVTLVRAPDGDGEDGGEDQVWWLVQRTKTFFFPDLISVAFVPTPGGVGVVMYSKSVYGQSDLGVNAKRVDEWMGEVEAVLA